MSVRINKYLSQAGYCSRRKADSLIAENRVTINERIPEMGTKVEEGDIVKVDGEIVENNQKKRIYLAVHKPKGVVCTTDSKVEKNNIVDFVNYPERIYPVGRLDKMSEGLIIMTNDGSIVNKIIHARNSHEKEYVVTLNRSYSDKFIENMSNGVPILDTITKKCDVQRIDEKKFKIILTQGLNRQIRRMCMHLGYRVTALKRTRIMHLELDLPVGKWRHLTKKEVEKFYESE